MGQNPGISVEPDDKVPGNLIKKAGEDVKSESLQWSQRLRSSDKDRKLKTTGFWPKIEIQLSEKEIQDYLLAMGATLPLRPKKRPTAVKKYVETMGFKNDASLLSAVITGTVNAISTFMGIVIVDRVGRKPLLLQAAVQMSC
ncbi:hypothetical protein AMTR_s00039p00110270 [Amborella trichopoda]|uniref:Major facilitator superfamily (MFS) profile domain-containing protein n=1 Tax=Amborella trichopoda TaxID=13333 RepID=U5D0K7_AMBTC|nr:hypothetical protein AMTR_s00039p00110270 [Amborella trichopoda]